MVSTGKRSSNFHRAEFSETNCEAVYRLRDLVTGLGQLTSVVLTRLEGLSESSDPRRSNKSSPAAEKMSLNGVPGKGLNVT